MNGKRALTPDELRIASRIKSIIKNDPRGLTEEAAGIACGVKQAQVSHWTGGREPVPVKRAAALAKYLHIDDPGEICVAYRQLTPNAAQDAEKEWPPVKAYAQAVGLGNGVEAQEYEETQKLKFRADSLARKGLRPDTLAVVYGKGDSMLPRIRSGDAILFDTSDTRPADGALFVIAVDGTGDWEYNVKRCKLVDDLVLFEADNPAGDHTWRSARNMANKRHPIKIVGRVRWIGSWEG